jgi:hypothetical protein
MSIVKVRYERCKKMSTEVNNLKLNLPVRMKIDNLIREMQLK